MVERVLWRAVRAVSQSVGGDGACDDGAEPGADYGEVDGGGVVGGEAGD